jgi:hypothetical protein
LGIVLWRSQQKKYNEKKKKIRSNREIARLETEGRKSGKSSNLTTQKLISIAICFYKQSNNPKINYFHSLFLQSSITRAVGKK